MTEMFSTDRQYTTGQQSQVDNRKRRRSRKACVPCSTRKRKCNGTLPCSSCDGFGYTCTYQNVPDSAEKRSTKRRRRGSVSSQSQSEEEVVQEPVKVTKRKHPEDHGVLEPHKNRYMGQHSSVAFARSLGLELKSDNVPRLHSFGWNAGLRPEPLSQITITARTFLPLKDIEAYAHNFFDICHPILIFLDKDEFMRRCTEHWTGLRQSPTFEALACIIFAVGSFFSPTLSHPREADAVTHAEKILDDPPVLRSPNFDYVAAMVCRCIYVRATTKPQISWIVTCQALHIAEAIGLHKDFDQVAKGVGATYQMPAREIEARARLFFILQTMNRILSYELGRTAITLDNVTCKNPWRFSTQDPAAAFVELGNILLNSEEGLSSLTSPEERRQRVTDCLTRLAEMPRDYLMLNASIADITFCIYRRLRIANQVISKEELKQVIDLGKSSIMAVRTLVEKNQPWWQILNTTFQFLCVLISIDSPEASAEIKEVLQTLEMVMNRYNTHLASEALETAKLLVHALKEKKRRELALLDECDNVVTPSSGNTVLLDDYNPFLAGEPLSLDPPLDFDWNFLFDPHIG